MALVTRSAVRAGRPADTSVPSVRVKRATATSRISRPRIGERSRARSIDRRGPGEETSYGNTGILGGSGAFPTAFPDRLSDLIRIAFKRAPEANYYLSFLPKVAPWLLAFRAATRPQKLIETAQAAGISPTRPTTQTAGGADAR